MSRSAARFLRPPGRIIPSPFDLGTVQFGPTPDGRAAVYTAEYPELFTPREDGWELLAKLRASKTDDNLLLLKTVMTAGHGGASGRFDKLHEVALAYAFALLVCGKAGS